MKQERLSTLVLALLLQFTSLHIVLGWLSLSFLIWKVGIMIFPIYVSELHKTLRAGLAQREYALTVGKPHSFSVMPKAGRSPGPGEVGGAQLLKTSSLGARFQVSGTWWVRFETCLSLRFFNWTLKSYLPHQNVLRTKWDSTCPSVAHSGEPLTPGVAFLVWDRSIILKE